MLSKFLDKIFELERNISPFLFAFAISSRKETFLYHYCSKTSTYAAYALSFLYMLFDSPFSDGFFLRWTSVLFLVFLLFVPISLRFLFKRVGLENLPHNLGFWPNLKRIVGAILLALITFIGIVLVWSDKHVQAGSANIIYITVLLVWPGFIVPSLLHAFNILIIGCIGMGKSLASKA